MKIKYVYSILFCALLLSNKTFSQSNDFDMYIAGANFLLDKTNIDPSITEIVEATLPKIINRDAEGAVSTFANFIYQKKHIKELNPDFLKYTTNEIKNLITIFPQKNYFDIIMSLSDLIMTTDDYLNNNILPVVSAEKTKKKVNSTVDTSSINKSLEVVKIDHQKITEKLKEINTANQTIHCITFTSFGGYAILFGTNGYSTNGLPKNALAKLKELHDNKKDIKQIAFTPTGGYIILYGKSGFSSVSVNKKMTDKLLELNKNGNSIDNVSFSPNGGYIIIYDKYNFVVDNVSQKVNDKLTEISSKKYEIKNIAFEQGGGYVINYGSNGWTSSQVTKLTNDKLNELNDNKKTINFISFITGGGHVIVYDNYGYIYNAGQ